MSTNTIDNGAVQNSIAPVIEVAPQEVKLQDNHPAVEYLKTLFQPEDLLCITFIHVSDGITENHFVPLFQVITAEGIKRLTERNSEWQIYVSMAPFKDGTQNRFKTNISEIRHAFTELDENGDAGLMAIRAAIAAGEVPPPTIIIESSPHKYQAIWNITGFKVETVEALNKALLLKFGGDFQSKDAARVLRIPGFRNIKAKYPEPKPIAKIIEQNGGLYTSADFKIPVEKIQPCLIRTIADDATIQQKLDFLTGAMDAARVDYFQGHKWGDGGFLFELKKCPWSENHTDGKETGAFSAVQSSGAYVFGCLHNHCHEKKWQEFKSYLEEQVGRVLQFSQPVSGISFTELSPASATQSSVNEAIASCGCDNKKSAEDTEDQKEPVQPLPPFPTFTGTLQKLAASLFPDLPYCLKFMCLVTLVGLMIAGRVQIEGSSHIQPRFYTIMVDEQGGGKGGSAEVTRQILSSLFSMAGAETTVSVDSGPALVMAIKRDPRLLLYCDELSALFEKAKAGGQTRSTLFDELLTLHDGNETGNDSKSNLQLPKEAREQLCGKDSSSMHVTDAMFALLGGVQPKRFPSLWRGTSGGASGLRGRFMLVSSGNLSVPEPQRPTDITAVNETMKELTQQLSPVLESPVALVLTIGQESVDRMHQWWKARNPSSVPGTKASTRMPAMLIRFLTVLAMTNGGVITEDLVSQTLAWGDYQIALANLFMPSDVMTWQQEFEELIKTAFVKHGPYLTFRDARRFVNPEQHQLIGGFKQFMNAWKTLEDAEVLYKAGTNRVKKPVFGYDTGKRC